MKAIVQDRYGPPSHLRLDDVEKPDLEEDRALVRVHAASVNAGDWRRVRGTPFIVRAAEGWRRPRYPLLGVDFAGVVESVGANFATVRVGDEVMGFRTGAFAEYVATRMSVPKPSNLSLAEAAAVPVAAGTALVALRDKGQLQPGQRVLVNGAGGGVGSFAVQIAAALGGEVTAVTRGAHVDLVRSLGAQRVIDYGRDDFTRRDERYDLIVDVGGTPRMGAQLRALAPDGVLVRVGAGKGLLGPLGGFAAASLRKRLVGQPVVSFIANLTPDHLLALKDLIEAGKVRPVIDRTYPLEQVPEAIAYLEREEAAGKVVITLA
ncbi:MAG TPA: NAD(P)-dependent alcohol dehydrogenase [Candidatus Limnocylindria bacterium]|nr:NAD(P)-dependent alcohol dehydrogenase [Candidatus Limnocylindria bacterium]